MAVKTPIWLDCDPGHDDAFAIILAAEHPNLDLLGISTVHGNASIPKVTANTISLLTAIGRTDIPVYSGCHKPFMRPAVHAPDIHGDSGIDGTDLLPPPLAGINVRPENAVLAMYNAIMKTLAGTCVVVATGTLTNVALCFATFPETVSHIKEVSIMGGAFGERPDSHGNITKNAEFNIYCDPESAQSIFSNPLLSGRITLVPLDLTHTVLATSTILDALLRPGDSSERPTNLRQMLHDLLTFFSKTYSDVFKITAGPPLHDPLAVAAIIPTNEISWVIDMVRVHVSCDDNDEVGRTIKTPKGEKTNEVRGEELGKGGELVETIVKIPKSVDIDAFWNVILTSIEKADRRYSWAS